MAKSKRKIKLRHIEERRLVEEKQKRIDQVPGAIGFEDENESKVEPTMNTSNEFMYPLNNLLNNPYCVPDLLSFEPQEISRIITERAGATAEIRLRAIISYYGAQRLEDYRSSFDSIGTNDYLHPNSGIDLFTYEGTLYIIETLEMTSPDIEFQTMSTAIPQRMRSTFDTAYLTAVASPERFPIKRNIP